MSAAFGFGDIRYAKIAASQAGANEIVAAISGYRIRVIGYVHVASGAVAAKWQSGTTDLSGAMSLITGTPVSAPEAHAGHFATAAGEALNLNLGGATAVNGHIAYVVWKN